MPLTVKRYAELTGVPARTVRHWCKHGQLETVKLGPGRTSPYRILTPPKVQLKPPDQEVTYVPDAMSDGSAREAFEAQLARMIREGTITQAQAEQAAKRRRAQGW